jgi:hypothetical protein
MLIDDTNLFLPLTEDQASALAQGTSFPKDCFASWTYPEVAATAVIQQVSAMSSGDAAATQCERLLSQLLSTARIIDAESGPRTFATAMAARFDRLKFAAGVELLPSIRTRFLDQYALAKRAYLLDDGSWDFTFSTQHKNAISPFTEEFVSKGGAPFVLTDSQARSFRVLKGELDEDLHIQALAGTGKTFLIERMVDLLCNYKPLILAMTKPQVHAVLTRIGPERAIGMTFGEFALEILQRDATCPSRLKWRSTTKSKVDDQVVATELHILPVGSLTPAQVASIALTMVSRYCASPDVEINESHIPSIGEKLVELDRAALVEYANRVWSEVREPRYVPNKLPVFYYHRQKQLSLSLEARIPEAFSHIIIDEAHDLPVPVHQFLSRAGVPLITLADSCQRLDGRVIRPSGRVRSKEIFQSVRAGRQIETAINTLIDQNPLIRVHLMEGNRVRDTKTVFYDHLDIPSEPTTILVQSDWGLFEYCQRLSAKGAPFAILPGSVEGFRRFVTACIRLYRDNIRPSYGPLFHYRTWVQLRNEKGETDPAFNRIDRMLQKGYSDRDFEQLLMNQVGPESARYLVGRVSDAKNMEVDSVMLTPDLLTSTSYADRVSVARHFAALYVGGTRARYRLYVPGHLREWASEQAAKAARGGGETSL